MLVYEYFTHFFIVVSVCSIYIRWSIQYVFVLDFTCKKKYLGFLSVALMEFCSLFPPRLCMMHLIWSRLYCISLASLDAFNKCCYPTSSPTEKEPRPLLQATWCEVAIPVPPWGRQSIIQCYFVCIQTGGDQEWIKIYINNMKKRHK